MQLSNLSIVISTNAEEAVASIGRFGAASNSQMQMAGQAADRYAARMVAASESTDKAISNFGSSVSAANDEIIQKSAQAEQAIEQVGQAVNNIEVRSMSEKVAAAFGTAFGTGYAVTQTWIEKTEEFVEAKTKAILIGLAIGVVSATAAAIYTAYNLIAGVVGFIKGLFTGDAYKSENIDALIKVNKVVMDLQTSLSISSIQAGALSNALDRLGVDPDKYVKVFTDASTAMHKNQDELDRLGVKYSDANGQLLSQAEFLGNVKTKLDEYREGYDRSAAAAAIGAGSYQDVVAALKVTDAQIAQSKERLDDYNLGIGPATQEAVEKYQQAMRDFNNESELTSQGFKRAIADSVMPILTDLANFFKDGFPSAVTVFRGAIASVTTLFYGLKTAVYAVAESVLGSVESIVLVVGGIGSAISAAIRGDFEAGREALLKGWMDAKNRFGQIGDNIVDQVKGNVDKVKMAWAMDGRDAQAPTAAKLGKEWIPAPKVESVMGDRGEKKPFDRYLEELERVAVKAEQTEYAMMRLKAAQEAARQKGMDSIEGIALAEDAINRIQRAESERTVSGFKDRLELENRAIRDQAGLVGMTANEQELLTAALRRRQAAEQLIIDARKAGKPLDDQAIEDLKRLTDIQVQAQQQLILQKQTAERTFSAGASGAFKQYADDAGNAARQAQSFFTNAFKNMEDALVEFAKTGKLSFSKFIDGVITDLLRIQVQKQLVAPLMGLFEGGGLSALSGLFGTGSNASSEALGGGLKASGGSGSGFVDSVASMFGLSKNAVGMSYVPQDMLVMVHEGEQIVPKGMASSAGVQVNIVEAPGSGGQVSRSNEGGKDVVTVLVEKVRSAVAADIARGSGPVSDSLSRTYGLNRVAGSY